VAEPVDPPTLAGALVRLLVRAPAELDALVTLALLTGAAGDAATELRLARRAVRAAPSRPEAWSALGRGSRRVEDGAGAVACHHRAIALAPDQAALYAAAVPALAGLAPPRTVATFAQRALRLEEQPQYRRYLALACEAEGDLGGALAALDAAIAADPDDGESVFLKGRILLAAGERAAALGWIRVALLLRPDQGDAWLGVGSVIDPMAGDAGRAHALAAFRRAALLTGDASAAHMVAALGGVAGAHAAGRTPAEHVRRLFNTYAPRFDLELVVRLGYRAPKILRDLVDVALAEVPPAARPLGPIYDLGCGTGLCGALFRDLARPLEGVDLSPRMLDMARRRGTHDRLDEDDLAAWLGARANGEAAMLLASDVFVFFGDLAEPFALARRALRPDGLFVFTVEAVDDAGTDWTLRPTGRFAHADTYVRAMALAHGFAVAAHRRAPLRRERDGVIEGDFYVLRPGVEAGARPADPTTAADRA
jgi:predicted TPR repeat methyltransferase